MLQEEQTVTFQPEYIWVSHPWYVNLFSWYLLFVFLLGIVGSIQVVWSLRKLRIASRQSESHSESISQERSEPLRAKASSFRNLSHLTVLISIIVLFSSLSDAFMEVATQKVAGIRAIAGAVADTLTISSGGVIIATGLFCIAIFCERLRLDRKTGLRHKSQTP
jgi:Na+/H+ antiporter NhaD/arsenite permease-like protein